MPRTVTDVQPLSARSVALSLLLGSHPRRMGPAELIQRGEYFGIAPSTLRVALTRAVASGDLRRVDGDYALGARLVDRQRRQDEGVHDVVHAWDGAWEMAVVVVAGRTGPDRATLRRLLAEHRLAELREGVWTRPANLQRPAGYRDNAVLEVFEARPTTDPAELATSLWDLDAWAATGEELVSLLARADEPARRLAVAAHIVRHLSGDPLLPSELLPSGWPGERLRSAYADYEAELSALTTT